MNAKRIAKRIASEWLPSMLDQDQTSLVSNISRSLDYDTGLAGAFCVALLEDVNMHGEAATLNAALSAEAVDERLTPEDEFRDHNPRAMGGLKPNEKMPSMSELVSRARDRKPTANAVRSASWEDSGTCAKCEATNVPTDNGVCGECADRDANVPKLDLPREVSVDDESGRPIPYRDANVPDPPHDEKPIPTRPDDATKIERLSSALKRMADLARRNNHHPNCAKSVEPDSILTKCNCGTDQINRQVDEALKVLTR